MNILAELTRHLILASKDIRIEKKEEKLEIKAIKPLPPQLSPTSASTSASTSEFFPSLSTLKPSLESISQEHNTDFGRLSELVSDNSITSIICDGPFKAVKIKKDGRSQLTAVSLDKQEIDSIIHQFSEKSGISIRPIFRASIGNLSILALVSSSESRFMLTKN